MVLYEKDEIKISTIEETDKVKVLKYFQENSFNCNYLDESLRPTDEQFLQIMDYIIKGKDDENNIFVIKKNGEVIGYESMFVEYDRLIIGHIAVKKSERGKGYGELLTRIAMLIAENEDRDVSLHCNYPNSYLRKIGFETKNNINYIYKRKNIKTEGLPKFFISVKDYQERQNKKLEEDLKKWADFLDSGIMGLFDSSESKGKRLF